MSKSLVQPTNRSVQNVKNSQSIQLKSESYQVPALREVRDVAMAAPEASQNLITAYKDLNQPFKDSQRQKKVHLGIAFSVFVLLGLGIMIGQKYKEAPRAVASADIQKFLPAGAVPSVNEHYHYDKSCYIGENGEQVCMTRTSRNHD